MELLATIFVPILGAFMNRLRGGWLRDKVQWGTQEARFVSWGVPSGLIAAAFGVDPYVSSLVAIAAFLGCVFGQYQSLSMGHRGGRTGYKPWLFMGLWGLLRVAPIAAVLALFTDFSVVPLVLAGIACPLVYHCVWYVPGQCFIKGFGYGDGPSTGYDPPELAEAIHGYLLVLGLILSIT